jgi:hypothetical protein
MNEKTLLPMKQNTADLSALQRNKITVGLILIIDRVEVTQFYAQKLRILHIFLPDADPDIRILEGQQA